MTFRYRCANSSKGHQPSQFAWPIVTKGTLFETNNSSNSTGGKGPQSESTTRVGVLTARNFSTSIAIELFSLASTLRQVFFHSGYREGRSHTSTPFCIKF